MKKGAGGFISSYMNPKTREAEDTFMARACQFAPPAPLTGPLRLEITFELPVPDGWPQWQRAAAFSGTFRHVKTPDVSNLLKLVEDACNGVFWADDKQLCEILARKQYSAVPQTHVTIYELEQAVKGAAPRVVVERVTQGLFG